MGVPVYRGSQLSTISFFVFTVLLNLQTTSSSTTDLAGIALSRQNDNNMLRHSSGPLLILSLFTLAACGGGGGGGSSNPPPPPPPAANTPPTFGTTSFNGTEDTDFAATLTATDAQGQAITFAKVTD